MAPSAPVALGLGGLAAVFLISGIQGKSVGSIVSGDFGKATDPEFGKNSPGLPEQEQKASGEGIPGAPKGLISPFRKKDHVVWGRSDQGVDGTVTPGAPMVAMGDGEVTVAHDPNGFGPNYPVLHIDGDGSYYYGHSVPAVHSGQRVQKGQTIAFANTSGQGNATTPGAFEIGKWPPGNFSTAGAAIRAWFLGLPRI